MPGASPDNMASAVAAPLERHLGQIADVTEMTSPSSLGYDAHHAAIRARPRHRRRGARRRGGDQRGARRSADQPAAESDLSQGQSRRRADHGARADLDARAPPASSTTSPPTCCSSGCRSSTASARSTSAAARCRRARGARTPARCSNTASASRTCARRSPRPTPTARRARSRTTTSTIRSTPTIRRPRPINIAISSSPTATTPRCKLADVAEVVDSVEDLRNAGLANGKPAIALVLSRQPGANIIQAVDGVKAELPRLIASLPGDVDLNVVVDRSITIRGSLADTETHADHRGRAGDPRRLRLPAQRRAPPRFRASPCRFRSSARSRRCICSASASTICR